MNELRAVIFDLDGVITDTAEYHYQAWQKLADDEGYPFDRTMNERLRGVSRSDSLRIILNGRTVSDEAFEEMMARKNTLYVSLLDRITPDDLLPGARELLVELRARGLRVGLGSASKNTPKVLTNLGITDLFDAVADGNSVTRSKPAPDVFLKAAEMLGVPAGLCAVVEDAEAGIDAALAGDMWAIGLGDSSRVGHAHVRFDSLAGVTLDKIRAGLEDGAWTVHEHRFDPDHLLHKETVFTTGNGNLCVRGAFEEGYPRDARAAFMHRVWDDMPISVSELAALPVFWGFDLWVDGVRFSQASGIVSHYDRRLDLRTGLLSRSLRWQADAASTPVRLHFERFVSLAEPSQACGRVSIVAEADAELRVRSCLDAHVENTGLVHWDVTGQSSDAEHTRLQVLTRATRIPLAFDASVTVEGASSAGLGTDTDGCPASEHRFRLGAGVPVTVTKLVAIVSGVDGVDPVASAAASADAARAAGWDALLRDNRAAWDRVWAATDVAIDGDPEAQVAVRFNLFALQIAAPRWTQRASIGAKTLSGFGYRHHTFWDTETFILPAFAYTQPEVARNMLLYRFHNLAGARRNASAHGYEGAQFPWESAGTGDDVTPSVVPDPNDRTKLDRIWEGEIEIHVTADVAYAVMQYWRVTRDDAFMRDHGAEIVLDGAKFWASAARLEPDGRYHCRNVIGPDEYHDRVDDNAFTNAMAAWHFRTAADVWRWLSRDAADKAAELSASLDLTPDRLAQWARVADNMAFSIDITTGLIEQFAGFFALRDVDQALLRDPLRQRSMQDLAGFQQTAASQVLKQPDVLMLQYLLADQFTPAQLRANYAYYDPRTDHEFGSSLGPAISAVMACRAGHADTAYGHFMRAARADLLDVRRNARDGIHAASAGGLWQAVVFGFAGLHLTDAGHATRPMLPDLWQRLSFTVQLAGTSHRVVLER